jgi:hypothetical protein
MSNVTQPSYVKYIRDRLNQHFPDTAAAPATAAAPTNATAPTATTATEPKAKAKPKAKPKAAKPVDIKAAPKSGTPTPAEQEKLQQRIAAADAASRLGPQASTPGALDDEEAAMASYADFDANRSRVTETRPNRRAYGGKYVRESTVDKMQKDFEHFVNNIG